MRSPMLLLVLVLLLSASSLVNAQDTATVSIPEQGTIRGWMNETYYAFFGIPYAQPPVGPLRWVSPQVPAPSWSGIRDAQNARPGCIQECTLPPHMCPETTSEDCLFLDVYVPLGGLPAGHGKNGQGLLPVMVFIPGGRFEQGAGSSSLYEGLHMVNRSNLILITLNYRLGALGLLATDVLGGNYAIQDQRVALEWVQANVKAFGGDPTRVTLFGQSAGGSSTAVHLVSPLSKGLFAQAIVQSNPWTLPMKPLAIARDLGNRFVKGVGCKSDTAASELACLRSINTTQILVEQKVAENHIPLLRPIDMFLPFTPTVDGIELTDQPRNLLGEGLWNKVPLMTGTVSNEALLFIWEAAKTPVDGAEYLSVGTYIFKEDLFKFLKLYPNEPLNVTQDGTDRRSRLAQAGTHYIFNCPERFMLRNLVNSTGDNFPIYRYQFAHHMQADAWGPLYAECDNELYVCHGSELPFVFDNIKPFYTFTNDEQELSLFMQTAWTNFAISGGNPNKPQPFQAGWPEWPAYSADGGANDNYMSFETPMAKVKSQLWQNYCDFWDEAGYTWGTDSK